MPRVVNNQGTTISLQAQNAIAVTPSDTIDLTHASTLYIGGTGNIKVNTEGGQTTTFTAIQKGTTLPVLVKRVWSTDTTATSIIALW